MEQVNGYICSCQDGDTGIHCESRKYNLHFDIVHFVKGFPLNSTFNICSVVIRNCSS